MPMIKARARQLWIYLRETVGIPVLILIALTGSYFLYSIVRDWRFARQVDQQNERIENYQRQTNEAISKASDALARFEIDQQATKDLLDTVQEMSGNIKKLADRDQEITIRVNDVRKEYEKTRFQNRATDTRSNVPLRQREDDVLRADSELYKSN